MPNKANSFHRPAMRPVSGLWSLYTSPSNSPLLPQTFPLPEDGRYKAYPEHRRQK